MERHSFMEPLECIGCHLLWFVLVLPFSGGLIYLFGKYLIHLPGFGPAGSFVASVLAALAGVGLLILPSLATAVAWIPLLLVGGRRLVAVVTCAGLPTITYVYFFVFLSDSFFQEDGVLLFAIALLAAAVTSALYSRHGFYSLLKRGARATERSRP